eukprot:339338-Amphidinium_carterae.3
MSLENFHTSNSSAQSFRFLTICTSDISSNSHTYLHTAATTDPQTCCSGADSQTLMDHFAQAGSFSRAALNWQRFDRNPTTAPAFPGGEDPSALAASGLGCLSSTSMLPLLIAAAALLLASAMSLPLGLRPEDVQLHTSCVTRPEPYTKSQQGHDET